MLYLIILQFSPWEFDNTGLYLLTFGAKRMFYLRFSVEAKVVLLQCEEGKVFTLAPCSERWWKCVT